MTKKEIIDKLQQEYGDSIEDGFVIESAFIEFEQAVRKEMIEIAEKIIDDYCWIDNNQQIIYKDIFLKEFKKLTK